MANCAAGADVTRVWDLGVRVFHWLMVATVATALVTGLSGPRNLLNIHIAAGAAIGGLVAFRMLWGLMGSTYARFSSFPVQLVAINEDLAGLVAGRRPRYLGHNPLGSLMALALLAIISSFRDDRRRHPGRRRQARPIGLCDVLQRRQGDARTPSGARLCSPRLDWRPSPGRRLRVCSWPAGSHPLPC